MHTSHLSQHLKISGPSLCYSIESHVRHLIAARYAESTIKSYVGRLKLLLRHLGNIPLPNITTALLEDLLLAEFPTNRTRATTRNTVRYTLRSFFGWAEQSGIIDDNPAELLRIEQSEPRRTPAISLEETSRLLKCIRSSSDRLRHRDETLFAVYAFTGIRRSAALDLRLNDYNKSTSLLRVNNKGGGAIKLPVVAALRKILRRYIALSPLTADQNGNIYLFPGRKGIKLGARQADKLFVKWKNVAGLRQHLTIHSFRSGLASALYAQTMDLLLIKKILGHADISTTLRYIERDFTKRLALEQLFATFA